jgi:hypothetical protein
LDQMKHSLVRIKFAGPLIPHFGTLLSMPRDLEVIVCFVSETGHKS